MTYLLDTNVISELIKPNPDKNVLQWFENCPEESMCISVLTIGEIESGIALLDDGKKKNEIITWFEELREAYSDKILPITNEIATLWGRMQGSLRREGVTIPVIDSFIGATALIHNRILVTRNKQDFRLPGIEIMNPWLD